MNNISIKNETVLSKRELEILQLIAGGSTNQEISKKLEISLRTVEGHKTKLVKKTASKNIVNLIMYALKNELVNFC